MHHPSFAILYWAIPIVIGAALVEALVLSRQRAGYDWAAAGISLGDLFVREAVHLLPLMFASPFFAWAWNHRIATVPLDSVPAFGVLFLGQEFCYYWYHRSAHRVRWFWATHSIHHSPNELNLSAAYRFGFTGRLTGSTLFFVPLTYMGFRPELVIAALSVNLIYQYWIHAAWIPRLGWLEYVLNTPSAHRVHHASNLSYLDGNYGGVLTVFDRMFGTYIAERDEEPCTYGLVEPVDSHAIWDIEFREWRRLMADLYQSRKFGDVLGYLLRPPGWRPDGLGTTTEDLRRKAHLLEIGQARDELQERARSSDDAAELAGSQGAATTLR